LLTPDGEPESSSAPSLAAAVTVQRASDPVWTRRPGERGEVAIPFFEKRARVPVGTLVRTGAGGRAELLWSPDASSLSLFEEGRVTLGDPEREEPMLAFHSLTRALLVLTPEDRVELLGGALLSGDPLDTTGPILLERAPGSILRVTNQSKRPATIAYRDERLELGPGESIDLPVLGDGSAPRTGSAPQLLQGPGFTVALEGRVERQDDERGVALMALGPARASALGVEVRLAEGATARFSALPSVRPSEAADPGARP
jgi:hypothetical protein